MRLPVEYQEVEYITNTAGAYIDTGVVVKGGLGFELKAAFQEGQATNSEFFGGGTSYSNAIGICTHSAGTLGVYVGTTEIFTYPWYELHTIKVDTDGSAYKDGVKMGQSTTIPSTTSNTMQIFRHSGTGRVQLEIVYLCKLFDSTGVLRDLVPCYRKSDNVVGMYDVQNDVFYTNAGTSGEFIAWNKVGDDDAPEQEHPTPVIELGSIDLIRRNLLYRPLPPYL